MTISRLAALAAGSMVLAAGCGDDGSGEGKMSSYCVSASGPDFTGNSVLICGAREQNADRKYPCRNEACECFNFEADGRIYEVRDGQKVLGRLEDLCPSNNFPHANWRFEYAIYATPDCQGTVLNADPGTNPHNFICYEAPDIAAQQFPNQAVESLEPGWNENQIICLTENAKKTFDFDVCVLERSKNGSLRLDCGCERDEQSRLCSCDQSLGNLPSYCALQPDDCDILCVPPPPVKIASIRLRSFANTGGEEVYLGAGDLDEPGNRVGRDYAWSVPGAYPIEFTYDPDSLTVSATLPGLPALVYELAEPLASLDSFEIVIGDRDDPPAQVNLVDVSLDGAPLGDFVGDDELRAHDFASGTLNDGFTFTGVVKIDGRFSASAELSKVEIVVGRNLQF